MRALEHPHQSPASHHDQAGRQACGWMSCHHRCRGWLRLMGSVLAHLALYASAASFSQRRTHTRSVSDGRLRQPSGISTEVHLATRMPHTRRRHERPVTRSRRRRRPRMIEAASRRKTAAGVVRAVSPINRLASSARARALLCSKLYRVGFFVLKTGSLTVTAHS